MGVGVGGVVNYANVSSGTASDVVAYGGVGGPYEYCSFFSVLNWFSKGEQGAWYDPSDFQPNWRRNLLTWSEDFSNAAWATSPTMVFSTNIIAPDGTNTANVINSAGTSVPNRLFFASGNYVFDITKQYSLTFYAKAISERYIQVYTNYGAESVTFDMQNGAVTQTTGIAGFSNGEGTLDQNGFYRFSVLYTPRTTSVGIRYSFTDNNPTPGYSPNIATTGLTFSFWGAQLEQSSSASTYQKITDGIQDYYTVQPQPVLFQVSAGTTPVTAVEQPVGLMLDKSKGLALGAELVTNGDFSNGTTGWNSGNGSSLSNTSNALIITGTAGYGYGYQSLTLEVGKTYKISWNIVATSSTPTYLQVTTTLGGANMLNKVNDGTGYMSAIFTATSIVVYANFLTASPTSSVLTIDNISVKQIAGNHAFQATSGNRPVLSARVNLLTKTEDFSDGVWIKAVLNGTLSSGNISPTGSTNATLYQENTTASVQRGLYETTTVVSGISYTATIYAKDYALGSKRYLTLFPQNITQSYAVYDLSNATVTFTGGANYLSSSISSIGNGWCKCSITFTTASTTLNSVLYLSNSPAIQTPAYLGDGVSGIYIWGADLRPTNSGALLPAYQRVNTASDYDTVGFPLYLKANGTSSAMSTNSIDFTSTDKMTVVTGVRKLSDANQGSIVELGTVFNNGGFAVIAAQGNNTPNYSIGLQGTELIYYSPIGYAAPLSSVVSLLADISKSTPAEELIPRINGVVNQTTLTGTTAGSGNFGNYPIHLIARNGISGFFNGQFYGAIIRGAQSDTASVTQTENYMAQKTGITF